MSKVGKKPIEIPEGINVSVDASEVIVKGAKGELRVKLPKVLDVEISDNELVLKAKRNDSQTKALHGTFRSLIFNNIKGVSEGWEKNLELVGTGYRAELKGNKLVLAIGFSHPVEFEAPEGIDFSVEKTQIKIQGIDKQLVGETAAKIRSIRPPEPYKGKGIKYDDEIVRRKPGKAAKAQSAAA